MSGVRNPLAHEVSIHARVERATHSQRNLISKKVKVSIHARVERATTQNLKIDANLRVSIHARVERATLSVKVN